jgi:acetyl esterase/lipase
VNWFGITDVKDLLAGPNRQEYAVNWLNNLSDKEMVAMKVSPLSYVRKGVPPVFTVHGDKDQLVPFAHAVKLHEALQKVGVPNKLFKIEGGRHGGFTKSQMNAIFAVIKEFLKANKLIE